MIQELCEYGPAKPPGKEGIDKYTNEDGTLKDGVDEDTVDLRWDSLLVAKALSLLAACHSAGLGQREAHSALAKRFRSNSMATSCAISNGSNSPASV